MPLNARRAHIWGEKIERAIPLLFMRRICGVNEGGIFPDAFTQCSLSVHLFSSSQTTITYIVIHLKVAAPHVVSPQPCSGSNLIRFIILATDGLWDVVSSAEAVQVAGKHLYEGGAASEESAASHLVSVALKR